MNEPSMKQAPAWAKELFDRLERVEQKIDEVQEHMPEEKDDLTRTREFAAKTYRNTERTLKMRTGSKREYCLEKENVHPDVVKACEEAVEAGKPGISRTRIEELFGVEKDRANEILTSIVENNADFERNIPKGGNKPSRLVPETSGFKPEDTEQFSGYF